MGNSVYVNATLSYLLVFDLYKRAACAPKNPASIEAGFFILSKLRHFPFDELRLNYERENQQEIDMALYDRDYFNDKRKFGTPINSSLAGKIAIAIGVLYLFNYLFNQQLYPLITLTPATLGNFELWRLFTSPIIPTHYSQVINSIFDVYIFYIFAKDVEEDLGSKKFIQLLGFTSLFGAIIMSIVTIKFPFALGVFSAPLTATALAYSLIYANRQMRFMIFFVLPVEIQGRTIGILIILYLIATSLFFNNFILSVLPLSAYIATYFIMKKWRPHAKLDMGDWFKKHLGKFSNPNKTKGAKLNKNQRNFKVINNEKNEMLEPLDDYISAKIDPILDKIAHTGMSSLTKEEKELLNKAKDQIKKS